MPGRSAPPGFGHLIYRRADPRAEYLLDRLPDGAHTMLVAQLRERRGWFPNVELAIAAFAMTYGLPDTSGELLFTVSRMAGWIAHALEEYDAEPLRFRLRGVYTGIRPGR